MGKGALLSSLSFSENRCNLSNLCRRRRLGREGLTLAWVGSGGKGGKNRGNKMELSSVCRQWSKGEGKNKKELRFFPTTAKGIDVQ